jgi:hypothetical protein
VNNEGFNNTKASANTNFSFDNNYNNTITNLGSEINNSSNNDITISDIEIELR